MSRSASKTNALSCSTTPIQMKLISPYAAIATPTAMMPMFRLVTPVSFSIPKMTPQTYTKPGIRALVI